MKIKKTIYTCLMLLTGIGASAQNNIYQYMQESQIMGTAIGCLDYDKYINQDFIPVIAMLSTDEGMAWFIDPVSYGQTTSHLWEFKLDPTKEKKKRVYADVFKCEFDVSSGTWTKGENVTTIENQSIQDLNRPIRNRIEYIIDNSIIMEKYQPEKKYYKTRGNNFVRIEQEGGNYKVYGSWQHNLNAPSICDSPVEMENGLYLPLTNPVMQTNMNVAKTLASHPEFSEFFEIIKACGAIFTNNPSESWTACDNEYGNLLSITGEGDVGLNDQLTGPSDKLKVIKLLNDFHYTIYVPTNTAMKEAYAKGLPTIADLQAAEDYDFEQWEYYGIESNKASYIREVMLNFVKYHIQDYSIFIDNGFDSGRYATAKHQFIKSATSDKYIVGKPYRLNVNVSASGLEVTDNMGNTRKVLTNGGLHNIPANEFWVRGNLTPGSTPYNFQLDNSSFVVRHAIDGPLMYSSDQFEYKNITFETEE